MLRIDDVQLHDVLGLRLNVWTSIVLFVAAGGVLRRVGAAPPRPRGGVYVRPPAPRQRRGRADEARRRSRRGSRRRDASPPRSQPLLRTRTGDSVSQPLGPTSSPARTIRMPISVGLSSLARAAARRRRRRENAHARVPAAPGALRPPPRARRLRRRLRRDPDRRGQPRHRGAGRSPRCATSTTAAPPAPSPTPATAPGILMQVPDAFLRDVVDFDLPPPARTPSARPSCPATTSRSPRPAAGSRRSPPRRASPSSAGATYPVNPDILGATARGVMPAFSQLFVAGADAARRGHGAGAAGVLPAQARRARDRRLLPVAVVAHPRLQGHADHRPARQRSSPTCADERIASRARRRPLAVLDQHLPELAAGPPVPVHRPQRRDQHRHGQPQLDAGPRGAAALRPDPGRPRAGSSRSAPPAPPTPPPSTRCSSCCTWAAARCRTRC